jgi:superoxide dismutase
MYKTDFIVRYNDIENELTKRYEHRIAEEIAAEISKAIQSSFNFSDINIVTNVNGEPITKTKVEEPKPTVVKEEPKTVLKEELTGKKKKRGRPSKKDLAPVVATKLEAPEVKAKELAKAPEVLAQAKAQTPVVEAEDDDEEDYKYTRDDIAYICDKLYRDELLSVFDADSLEDPKMDAGIKMVFEHLIKHDEFIQFLEELSPKVMDKSKVKTEQEQFNFKRNTDYLIFITMFSHQLFYLTHQCICKMLVNEHVGDELIGDLKGKLLQIFSHC